MAESAAVPMFPLQSALLPGETLPLRIFEPRYSQMVEDCLQMAEPAFGVVLISRGREVGGGDVRSDVGATARISHCASLGMGRYRVVADVGDRLRVTRWLPDDPYPRAVVSSWPDEPGPTVGVDRIGQLVASITALYQRVAEARGGRLRPDALAVEPEVADDPARHVYELAARVPIGPADRYAVLAAPTLSARVDVLLDAIETVTALIEFQLSDE